MADFAAFAAKKGATPNPNLTRWLRDHPDIVGQIRQAQHDRYDPDVMVEWFKVVSGFEVGWEQLRKRVGEIARTER